MCLLRQCCVGVSVLCAECGVCVLRDVYCVLRAGVCVGVHICVLYAVCCVCCCVCAVCCVLCLHCVCAVCVPRLSSFGLPVSVLFWSLYVCTLLESLCVLSLRVRCLCAVSVSMSVLCCAVYCAVCCIAVAVYAVTSSCCTQLALTSVDCNKPRVSKYDKPSNRM